MWMHQILEEKINLTIKDSVVRSCKFLDNCTTIKLSNQCTPLLSSAQFVPQFLLVLKYWISFARCLCQIGTQIPAMQFAQSMTMFSTRSKMI